MTESVAARTAALSAGTDRRELRKVLGALQADVAASSNQVLASAGLVITATTGLKVPKTGASDFYAQVGGALVKIAAGTDMPALSGSVAHGAFNVFAFTVDNTGTVTSAMGTPGAALGAVAFPAVPANAAVVGYVVINPTGTGSFVGGTTALNDATVVPNAVYLSPMGSVNPLLNTLV